jgi:hypothetical protein
LACLSSAFFLIMRSEGKGRPFGPRSRPWAVLIAGFVGSLSTAGALALATVGHYVPTVIMSLGVAAPSALCLDRIREGMPERRSTFRAAMTLWLSYLIERMDDEIAEAKAAWRERRMDCSWEDGDLLMAAHCYHDYLVERMSGEEIAEYQIRPLLESIETRLDIVRLIEIDTSRSKILAAIRASHLSQEARIRRYTDDLTRLAARLRHDAERELGQLLAIAYSHGFYRMKPYVPPARVPRQCAAEAAGMPRAHP